MLKQLKKTDVMTSPFRATKARELYNVQNPNTVILEQDSGSIAIPNTQIALDYVDYFAGNPLLNRDCDIALEQQAEDAAVYEEGLSGSNFRFDPNTAEKNPNTGTYKTLLYNQMYRAFYNNYLNPTKIFGMENIDFPLNKTNLYLAERFRMFTIPKFIVGDKIAPGSVQFQDTSFDDNVSIQDDSNGNLVAGNNLFSKIQEVRFLGNDVLQGTSSFVCPGFTPESSGSFVSSSITFENHVFDLVCFDRPYMDSASILNGTPPFIYSISGTLPAGLYFNAISASIFGTSSVMPVSSMVYQIELFVTDSLNNTASQIYYLTASYCGAWEPWDEYITGSDVIGLNGGYGFSSPWYVKPDRSEEHTS